MNKQLTLFICGLDPRGLEYEHGLQEYEAAEQARRQNETEEDAAAICQTCGGGGFAGCPDLEFEDHVEEGCRYGCSDGDVVCTCVDEAAIAFLAQIPRDDGDLVDEIG